jgi:hypothetical protein
MPVHPTRRMCGNLFHRIAPHTDFFNTIEWQADIRERTHFSLLCMNRAGSAGGRGL